MAAHLQQRGDAVDMSAGGLQSSIVPGARMLAAPPAVPPQPLGRQLAPPRRAFSNSPMRSTSLALDRLPQGAPALSPLIGGAKTARDPAGKSRIPVPLVTGAASARVSPKRKSDPSADVGPRQPMSLAEMYMQQQQMKHASPKAALQQFQQQKTQQPAAKSKSLVAPFAKVAVTVPVPPARAFATAPSPRTQYGQSPRQVAEGPSVMALQDYSNKTCVLRTCCFQSVC